MKVDMLKLILVKLSPSDDIYRCLGWFNDNVLNRLFTLAKSASLSAVSVATSAECRYQCNNRERTGEEQGESWGVSNLLKPST